MLDGQTITETDPTPQPGEATDAEPTPEPEKKETIEEPPKPEEGKSAIQRRIDQLVYERKKAESENARLMAMLEKTIPEKPTKEVEKEPTEFATVEEYAAHLVEKGMKEKMKELDDHYANKALEQEAAVKIQSFNDRAESFAEKNPDFYDAINDPSLPTSKTISQSIIEAEKGPEVAYFLAKNPGELNKILTMSPYQQALALGKIEAKIEAGTINPSVKVSSAPAPIKPNRGSGGAPESGPNDKMSIDQWMAAEKARLKKIGRIK